MTIKEYAKQKSISVQAIYGRLKAAGISVGTVTDGGKITPVGLDLLNEFYTDQAKQASPTEMQFKIDKLSERCAELERKCADLEQERDGWQGRCADLEKRCNEIGQEREDWKSAAGEQRKLTQNMQELYAQLQQARLPEPRRHWWQRNREE